MSRDWRERVILACGSLGGIGYVPIASGTVTVAVLGIPLFYLLHQTSLFVQLSMAVGFFLIAVWLSAAGDRILGEQDSSKMVVDEIAGYLVAVIGWPFMWETVLLSFILERIIDIVKVPPANWIERHVPGGWGVVLDDIVAGLYTLLIMHVINYYYPWPWN
ncbi:MAG: Phosphatidylglycerophosphatase A [Phycisphaerae bacterium]|nr:Phosphatidylglycerophosphatase A [Phycisphaerae bacterium]